MFRARFNTCKELYIYCPVLSPWGEPPQSSRVPILLQADEEGIFHWSDLHSPALEGYGGRGDKAAAIRKWLFEMHDDADYKWETCSKVAGTMSLV